MKRRICFLLLALLISALAVAGVGAWLKYALFSSIGLETQENIIALPFVLMADKELSYSMSYLMEARDAPPRETAPTEAAKPPATEATQPTTETTRPPETVPTQPAYVPVDESWFDDALFIGESRTASLQNFARPGKADFFCGVNLTVYEVTIMHKTDLYYSHKKLEDLLTERTYGKIFIHFGINESAGNIDMFIAGYRDLIQLIREHQPDAVIILQAIMPVTRGYAARPIFLPEHMSMMNERIRALAVDEHFRYIDPREWCADEEGFLLEEYTNDGCHPDAKGCEAWAAWLLEKAGWLNIP